jgi:hypothetical protein
VSGSFGVKDNIYSIQSAQAVQDKRGISRNKIGSANFAGRKN